jgi:hypothetical protein
MGESAQTVLYEINPGNAVDGTVVFDVPKDTKIAQLELHDSPFSAKSRSRSAERQQSARALTPHTGK